MPEFGDEFGDDDDFDSGFGDSPGSGQPGDEFGVPFQPGGQDIVGGGDSGGFSLDWESLVNLFLGLGVGYLQAQDSNQAREAVEAQIGRARERATPEAFIDIFKTLQPLFREIVASGAGPQLQGALLSGLAKSGGKDTGRGLALAAAGATAGETLALNLTAQESGRVQAGQVGAELGGIGGLTAIGPRQDPIISALVSGAAGFFGTSALDKKEEQTAEEQASLFPNIKA